MRTFFYKGLSRYTTLGSSEYKTNLKFFFFFCKNPSRLFQQSRMERTVDIEPIDMRHQKPKGFHLDDQLYIKTGNVYEVDPTELPEDFKFQSYSYGNRVYLSNKHQIWLKAQEEGMMMNTMVS